MERSKYTDVRQHIDITPTIKGPAIDVLRNHETRFQALVHGRQVIEKVQTESLGLPRDRFDDQSDKLAEELITLNRKVRRDLIKETGSCDVSSTGAVPRAVTFLETATLYAKGEALPSVGKVAVKEDEGWVFKPVSKYQSPNYYGNNDK